MFDRQGVEGVQCAWGGAFWEACLDLEVAVESPPHQHRVLPHIAHQGQAVVLSALQLVQAYPELPSEHIDPARSAELLLAHFPSVEFDSSVEVLLLLEDLENAVDAQLQAVVHAAAEDLLPLCFEEGEGWSCEDIDHSLFEEAELLRLEDLKGFVVAGQAQSQLALVAKAKYEDFSLGGEDQGVGIPTGNFHC